MEGRKLERGKRFKWKEGVSFMLSESYTNFSIKIFYKGEYAGIAKLRKTLHWERMRGVIKDVEFTNLDIKPDFQDKRLSSNLLEEVNHFIKSKEMLAYLIDAIRSHKNLKEKEGLYARHGWEKVENTEDRYKLDARKKHE